MPAFKAFITEFANKDTPSGLIQPSGVGTFYGQAVGGSGEGQSIHLRWTGTIAGTLSLWYSNKREPDLTTDTDWVQDTSITLTNPAGAAGSTFMDTTNTSARLRRLKYVNASGAGTLTGEIEIRGY